MTYVLIALICLIAGASLGWFAALSRHGTQTAVLSAKLEAAQDNEIRLEQSLRTVTADATAQSKRALTELLDPLHRSLHQFSQHVGDVEKSRLSAYAELKTQVTEMANTGEALRTQTNQLVSALRAPQVRGRWGEHQLKRIVEAAGMLEHCDFNEQVTATIDERVIRPDLIVRLAGEKNIVVDAKAPFSAYLDAMETRDETARNSHLEQHAKHLRSHITQLSKKEYWRAFTPTPEFVVLFMPADAFLDEALRCDPTVMDYAFTRNIVLATPATLIALLRTIAYTWRQEALAKGASQIHDLGRQMYGRLSTMSTHFTKLGSSLSQAVQSYNSTVGSLESRVLVSARRLVDLGVSTEVLPNINQIDVTPRQPQHEALREESPTTQGKLAQ